MTVTPQDDLPTEQFGPDHECVFTPYPTEDEGESWHYLRRCGSCGTTWYSLHCRCEQPNRTCGIFNCRKE